MTLLLPTPVHLRAYYQNAATDQLVATPGTPQAVILNQVSDNQNVTLKNASNQVWNGTTITTGQRFVFTTPGDYLLSFVANPVIVSGQPGQFRIWWKVNNTTDVVGSSTSVQLVTNAGAVGTSGQTVITRSLITDFAVGDYIELWMDAEKANTGLRSMAPATGPVAPAVVVNINMIGYN
jgi:hypothetical protein